MTNERDELLAVIFPVLDGFFGYRGGYPADVDKAVADAIIAAGYSKASRIRVRRGGIKVEGGSVTITGDTPPKPDLTIGERITTLEHGLREPEWGVSWGDEIRPVPDKARAKYIARVMGADLYGRYPLGKWMKVVA